ncbi:hypothetical protein PGN04_28020 [Klebsiella quasipneumoniae subsp. quasipneumoniae]|nr:hypothetical protein [Klebsiella quasipneumoniae subsp. quasipneumoniae]
MHWKTVVTLSVKHTGLRSKKGKKTITLVICEDGTAYRGDVDLTIANAIRTQKEMRAILGLPAKGG